MFRHVLIPTDGSPLSDKAVTAGVSLAKDTGARLTFFYAQPDQTTSLFGDAGVQRIIDPKVLADSIGQHTQEVLGKARQVAEGRGVKFEALSAISDDPYKAIIAAAQRGGCDLILMASHGRRGVSGLLLGSQTQKVLAHSSIPVLVFR